MLLQSLRALCVAPGRHGSIWKYLGARVRSTGVSGWFVCGFWTDLHFADASDDWVHMYSDRDLGRGFSSYHPGLARAHRQLSECAHILAVIFVTTHGQLS